MAEFKKDSSSIYYEALNRHIYGKPGNSESKSVSEAIHLTEAEKDRIRKHRTIRLGIDPEFVPFEYRDAQGKYQGISSDYVKIINDRTGLNMQAVDNLSWKKVIERIKNKEIDVLPCVGETEERKEYLNFSKPYAHYQRVIIMLSDAPFIAGIKDIQGKKVGVQAGSSHEGFLKEQTAITPITYPTLQEGLMALSGGQIEAFVANIASASYWIRKLNLTNLKVAAQASFEIFSLRFAVRKDFPELVSIINKGLNSISPEEEQEIQRRWVTVEYKTGVDPNIIWKYVLYVSSGLLLVLSFILFWNYRLKKEISIREKAELELEKHAYELEKANERLKELDHLKNMFIASVSHELRTPLNSIIGFTGIILKGMTGELNPKQKDQLSRVYSCANHLLGLITDVIDISKIEAGRIDVYPKQFRVIEIIQEAITSVQPQVQAKSLTIESDVPEDIIVNTDRKRFQQCILNYLSNAVKYSEKGTIKIVARDLGEQVEVRVSDTGIGISQADIQRLFEPFERIDSHLRVKAGGTGLGLYLTRKIAQELLKGDISVESELNKGSVFGITIRKDAEVKNETGIWSLKIMKTIWN
ncbi:MAG: transporter substrate-binding domain-containing protein [Desulfobacteraceae bacterium]|nr:transporter substrate-binding domain-containing protein [Desulfobacteraceae bacterium]